METIAGTMKRPRVAVVGCGLQAELTHLRTIAESPVADLALLVDKVVPTAERLAEKYRVPAFSGDYREAIGKVDAALLALPNYLHAPVAVDLLRHGIHVLVEKPMALNSKECDEMIAAADMGKAILAVGLDFRFTRGAQFTYDVLRGGLLGDVLRFDLRLGNDLTNLSLRSDYLLRKELAGGGVLIDLAVHALDLILWWLGDYETVEYYDDAMGGVEANCEARLRLRSGACGLIEASRTRQLRNTCIISGERGVLEIGLWTSMGLLKLEIINQSIPLKAEDSDLKEVWRDVFRRQFNDFIAAIAERREPLVSGRQGRRSIELIDECYSSRRELPQPWLFPVAETLAGNHAAH
jgi:predicted dehydrogenase